MLPSQKPNHLLCLGLLFVTELGLLLGNHSLLLPLTGSLGLRTLGIHLLLEDSLACLLSLRSVDMLNQGSLVLESVTLAQVVEFVVQVLVDLATGTVLDKKTSEDTKTTHPNDLARHTSIRSTLPLTKTTVSTNSSCSCEFPGTRSRMHGNGLSDDEAICDELSDSLAGIGVGDLAGLIGVEPDLALSAADNGCCQTLLGGEVDHLDGG
jgi:hypothetical protein